MTKRADNTNRSTDVKTYRIALVGNPNCGKTTLFNHLTGSRQHVGNWPGVTVEKKVGFLRFRDINIEVLDLPGIYSLSPYSSEEIITRKSLIEDAPDLIINIVDATNLERNLYLTMQLLELQKPMLIAFNMIDIVEKKGDIVDYTAFRSALDVTLVPISANKGVGLSELLDLAIRCIENKKISSIKKIYDEKIENVLLNIEFELNKGFSFKSVKNKINVRWVAIKLFENDAQVIEKITLSEPQFKNIKRHISEVPTTEFLDTQVLIADQKYNYIYNLCQNSINHKRAPGYITLTDKIDRFVTNKFFAIPFFALVMVAIFYLTFGPLGTFLRDQLDFFIKEVFGNAVLNLLTSLYASDWAKSLVVDGVIEGVGSVLAFLPQVMILFTLLSILEDSGYMARAAFIMDKLLRKVGLSGKAFVPLLMGFGCTVPAVLGTRILEKDSNKKLTILMIPFMSCSAKMPVYAMFISALFREHQLLTIFSIYLLGILIAILTAVLFNKPVLHGDSANFIMELPQYKLPSFKNLCIHVGEKLKDFIVKAGTILVAATIVIWFLQSFNFNFDLVPNSSDSILASIGKFIAPAFSICGFGDWRAAVSLLSGLIAKESVVSTMSLLYGANATFSSTSLLISFHFTPLSAYAFIVFVLLYTPCVAAMSAIYKELKSPKWSAIAIGYQLVVAWLASAFVYQFGLLFSRVF